jgi:hypothetical protein
MRKSRKRLPVHPLAHISLCRSALLVNYKDKFTFINNIIIIKRARTLHMLSHLEAVVLFSLRYFTVLVWWGLLAGVVELLRSHQDLTLHTNLLLPLASCDRRQLSPYL